MKKFSILFLSLVVLSVLLSCSSNKDIEVSKSKTMADRGTTVHSKNITEDTASVTVATKDKIVDIEEAAGDLRPLFDLSKVSNLDRLKNLTKRQKNLLAKNGFFLAHQPDKNTASSAAQVRTARNATHLFHIYERNDYIRMPSIVTADVAIDLTHSYFSALLRSLENNKFVPLLSDALKQLAKHSDDLLVKTNSQLAKKEVKRTAVFWAVALRLLEQSAKGDAPESEYKLLNQKRPDITRFSNELEPLVRAAVKTVFKAKGSTVLYPSKNPVILDKMLPRGNYTRTGVLQRYFRTMSWLGLLKYNTKGPSKDIEGIALLSRSILDNPNAAKKLGGLIEVTSFLVGKPDAATLDNAAVILNSSVTNAATISLDELLDNKNIALFEANLAKKIPPPKIRANNLEKTPHVCAIGKRPFNDAVAMQSFIETAINTAENDETKHLLPALMGGLGSAAVLGSKTAFDTILKMTPMQLRKTVTSSLEKGISIFSKIESNPFNDAYHGTLYALKSLLSINTKASLKIMGTDAWQKKSLFTYCGGWTELRHDTILYGAEMGAECDVPDEDTVPCWVEPVPELYGRLIQMIRTLDEKLKLLKPEEAFEENKDEETYYSYISSPEEKTKQVLGFLEFLNKVAKMELAKKPLDEETREQIMTIGGRIEWILTTLADSALLDKRDKDMAVVADVFNYQTDDGPRMVLEVGISDPDLIYALIPGSKGYVLSRGGVMSYREHLRPSAKRLTDEKWREMIEKKSIPKIPKWVKDIYAESVNSVLLKKEEEGRYRCGMNSGSALEI